MSSRLYPLYQRGNPSLRVFLPNFTMLCARPKEAQPKNVVTFHCSMQMTEHDIHQYLTKIYKIPVKNIRVDIEEGPTRKAHPGNYLVKDDDTKVAYITLGENMTFEFPQLWTEESLENQFQSKEEMDKIKDQVGDHVDDSAHHRPGLPTWFSL